MNLIDRDKLVEELVDLYHLPKTDKCQLSFDEAIDKVLKIVEEQPQVNQWISVEECCPTESCLLQFEDGSMAVGFYDFDWECWRTSISGEDYIILHEESKKPIKWQPLPELYEEKENVD